MRVFSLANCFLVTAWLVYVFVDLEKFKEPKIVHLTCAGVYLITGGLFGVSMYVDRVETYRSALCLMILSFLIVGVEIIRANMCKSKV